MDMYYGKGLMAKKEYGLVYAACSFPLTGRPTIKCDAALEKASAEVGPHNVYDIYDNCPTTEAWLAKSGKSMRWLRKVTNETAKKIPKRPLCFCSDHSSRFFPRLNTTCRFNLDRLGTDERDKVWF